MLSNDPNSAVNRYKILRNIKSGEQPATGTKCSLITGIILRIQLTPVTTVMPVDTMHNEVMKSIMLRTSKMNGGWKVHSTHTKSWNSTHKLKIKEWKNDEPCRLILSMRTPAKICNKARWIARRVRGRVLAGGQTLTICRSAANLRGGYVREGLAKYITKDAHSILRYELHWKRIEDSRQL